MPTHEQATGRLPSASAPKSSDGPPPEDFGAARGPLGIDTEGLAPVPGRVMVRESA
ncbi:hypothetical protein ABT186_26360 [Streptomyces sp. NPDC001634]|uniref:hypothetical protein n=1 Tax=Streptomyces sp. NPDC001634 TaxID=3154390 RepID=UPI0033327A4D